MTITNLLSRLSTTLLLSICGSGMIASAQYARVLTTSGDRLQSLEELTMAPYGDSTDDAIILRPNSVNQEIDGFGYAITYASCYNLMKMTDDARKHLLRQTFSLTDGYGVSYVRISIGCNDFSSREYTLCDDFNANDPLGEFSLQTDETQYIIPILKEIIELNPALKIIAAPWTPPRWMKYHEERGESAIGEGVGDWTGGRLRQNYYKVYGEYFVKFIQAMANNGVTIYAVSPQNEPLNWGNSASMYMPYTDMADFVSQGLAPALKQAGLTTKIYIYDHNYDYDESKGLNQHNYPLLAYQRMGSDFEGEELVVGACYHNYGGKIDDIKSDIIYGDRQDKELIFTEASIGEWNDGRNLEARLAYDMDELVISTTLNRFKASIVWNFMLDTNKSPYRPNGCSTCYGAVDLDVTNLSDYTFNSHYYIMAHASDAVKPGAKRIDTEGWSRSGISYAAFVNPDNTTAILISNKSSRKINVKVNSNGHTYLISVPRHGVVSAQLDISSEASLALPEDDIIQSEKNASYYNLKGIKTSNSTANGVYLRRQGNHTEKVIKRL